MSNIRDQAIALGAIFEAALQVDKQQKVRRRVWRAVF